MYRRDAEQTVPTSMDSSPLLEGVIARPSSFVSSSSSPSRRGRISRIIRLVSGRRGNNGRTSREPSILVRETAADHLEERQSDWAYSKPVVILDLLWNLAFITVSIVVLFLSRKERPSNPLRLWIVVYSAQCFIHMVCVWAEYRSRGPRGNHGSSEASHRASDEAALSYLQNPQADMNAGQNFDESEFPSQISLTKRIESANTSFSFVWWVIGFYWTTTGPQSHDAPFLFWLCVAFLAFDVFFVVFCVTLACIIGIAVCCCLPCIIAIMYAVAEQQGASDEDIELLPKYKFRRTGNYVSTGDASIPSGGVMSLLNSTPGASGERILQAEDVECCICISSYEDAVELRELPCGHHFHCGCIDRWLRMNSTCPLCKLNVSKSNATATEDV